MSRRQPIQHEWETPGYTFSLQPPWPPGFEPQLVLRTVKPELWVVASDSVTARVLAVLHRAGGTATFAHLAEALGKTRNQMRSALQDGVRRGVYEIACSIKGQGAVRLGPKAGIVRIVVRDGIGVAA